VSISLATVEWNQTSCPGRAALTDVDGADIYGACALSTVYKVVTRSKNILTVFKHLSHLPVLLSTFEVLLVYLVEHN